MSDMVPYKRPQAQLQTRHQTFRKGAWQSGNVYWSKNQSQSANIASRVLSGLQQAAGGGGGIFSRSMAAIRPGKTISAPIRSFAGKLQSFGMQASGRASQRQGAFQKIGSMTKTAFSGSKYGLSKTAYQALRGRASVGRALREGVQQYISSVNPRAARLQQIQKSRRVLQNKRALRNETALKKQQEKDRLSKIKTDAKNASDISRAKLKQRNESLKLKVKDMVTKARVEDKKNASILKESSKLKQLTQKTTQQQLQKEADAKMSTLRESAKLKDLAARTVGKMSGTLTGLPTREQSKTDYSFRQLGMKGAQRLNLVSGEKTKTFNIGKRTVTTNPRAFAANPKALDKVNTLSNKKVKITPPSSAGGSQRKSNRSNINKKQDAQFNAIKSSPINNILKLKNKNEKLTVNKNNKTEITTIKGLNTGVKKDIGRSILTGKENLVSGRVSPATAGGLFKIVKGQVLRRTGTQVGGGEIRTVDRTLNASLKQSNAYILQQKQNEAAAKGEKYQSPKVKGRAIAGVKKGRQEVTQTLTTAKKQISGIKRKLLFEGLKAGTPEYYRRYYSEIKREKLIRSGKMKGKRKNKKGR